MYENLTPTAEELRSKARLHMRNRTGTIAGFLLLFLLLSLVSLLIPIALRQAIQSTFGSIIFFIAFFIIIFILLAAFAFGLINLSLKAAREKDVDISDGFITFKNRRQIPQFLAYAFISCLYYLLFIIPGIIKSYDYSMTCYILLDNPQMSVTDAMNKSEKMMDGNKWRLFCLQFSFIGWILLANLTYGLLNFWLIPYTNVAFAEFYEDLRKKERANEHADNTAEKKHIAATEVFAEFYKDPKKKVERPSIPTIRQKKNKSRQPTRVATRLTQPRLQLYLHPSKNNPRLRQRPHR